MSTCAYSVVKDGRYWAVLDGQGKPVYGNGYHKRKRDAVEAVTAILASEEYEQLCTEQDKAGVYVWTPDEEKQITEYAATLAANLPRWTFYGQFPIQRLAREQHAKEAAELASPRTDWIDPERYYREKRRVMAARVEAFKRAGLEL